MVSHRDRRLIRQRAKFFCEYCHSPEFLSPDRFTIDHLLPRSLGGSDDINNLALACHRCNEHRHNHTEGLDPETQTVVPLFNPRQQQWDAHFIWTASGTRILGMTPTGRATCQRLDINDERYADEDSIRKVRELWVQVGWHPPSEDPRQTI